MARIKQNIYDILKHLENRRALYLGNNHDFNSLDAFIAGFTIAASDEQLVANNYPPFDLFSVWLLGHLDKHYGLSGGWNWQLMQRNPGNEEKAFYDFFSFLEIYKNSTTSKKAINLTKSATEHYNLFQKVNMSYSRDGVAVVKDIKEIVKVIWTSFNNSTTILLNYYDKNDRICQDSWELNSDEATERLSKDFGSLIT